MWCPATMQGISAEQGRLFYLAEALDGTDRGVRLSSIWRRNLAARTVGRWNVKLYEDDSREMIDSLREIFIAKPRPLRAQRFESLTPELAKKYQEKFKNPERFSALKTES